MQTEMLNPLDSVVCYELISLFCDWHVTTILNSDNKNNGPELPYIMSAKTTLKREYFNI